jgi:putative PIN family toxin of toxin-antitoxin system
LIQAVLDTNIIASGLAFPGGLQEQILRRATYFEFEIVISDHVLSELTRALSSPFFVRLLESRAPTDLYDALMQIEPVKIERIVQRIATHPEDDDILATALSGGADYLVTGDKQLLKLASFEGVRIVDSRTFLEILEREETAFGE